MTGIQPNRDADPTKPSYDPLTSQSATIQNDQTKVSFGCDASGWRACRAAAPTDNLTAATTWCVRDQSGRAPAETNGKAATALHIYGPTGPIAMPPKVDIQGEWRPFASPYMYVNNPISFEDPTGEWFG